jgi:hypothetical protein
VRGRGGRWSAATAREPKARHGRREVRLLWALAEPALNAYVGSAGSTGMAWPHLQQVCRVERRRRLLRRGRLVKEQVEVGYAVTSLPPDRAGARTLLAHLRGHWGIENRLHWVRDVTLDEDRCQVRAGAAPHAVAACRNLALALLRRSGAANIAAALRSHAGRPRAAVALLLSGGRT